MEVSHKLYDSRKRAMFDPATPWGVSNLRVLVALVNTGISRGDAAKKMQVSLSLVNKTLAAYNRAQEAQK